MTQSVEATFTVSLIFPLPKNADGEKLMDEHRLYVKYGTLFLTDKHGNEVRVQPVELPDFKYPESVTIETDLYDGSLDIDGFSEDSSDDEEEEEKETSDEE